MASNVCADSPRSVEVTVVIEDDTGRGSFRLKSDEQSGGVPIAQDFVLQFNNNQNDEYSNGFLVSFNLPANEARNRDWVFDDPAIWVKLVDRHGACPRHAQDHTPNILKEPTLSQDMRTLSVRNENSNREYFGFALRFQNTGNGRRLDYDPIGDNQNGNLP